MRVVSFLYFGIELLFEKLVCIDVYIVLYDFLGVWVFDIMFLFRIYLCMNMIIFLLFLF